MGKIPGTQFFIEEFVPKSTYDKWGDKSRQFIVPQIISGCQLLKDLTGNSVVVNDWLFGGQYNFSGYRPPDCKEGAFESAHKRGLACDIKVKQKNGEWWSGEQTRNFIVSHWDKFKVFFSTMEENTPTWCHVDCRWQLQQDYKTGPVLVPVPK